MTSKVLALQSGSRVLLLQRGTPGPPDPDPPGVGTLAYYWPVDVEGGGDPVFSRNDRTAFVADGQATHGSRFAVAALVTLPETLPTSGDALMTIYCESRRRLLTNTKRADLHVHRTSGVAQWQRRVEGANTTLSSPGAVPRGRPVLLVAYADGETMGVSVDGSAYATTTSALEADTLADRVILGGRDDPSHTHGLDDTTVHWVGTWDDHVPDPAEIAALIADNPATPEQFPTAPTHLWRASGGRMLDLAGDLHLRMRQHPSRWDRPLLPDPDLRGEALDGHRVYRWLPHSEGAAPIDFAPSVAPVFHRHFDRIEPDSVCHGVRDTPFAPGTDWDVSIFSEFDTRAETERCLWTDLEADGSGHRLILTDTGTARYDWLSPGGAVAGSVESEPLFGRFAITGATPVNVTGLSGGAQTPIPMTRVDLTLATIPADINIGDTVRLSDPNWPGLHLVVRADIGTNVVRVIWEGGHDHPVPEPDTTLELIGLRSRIQRYETGSRNYNPEAPRCLPLRAARRGDVVTFYVRHREIGSGSVAAFAGVSEDATGHLGAPSGSGLASHDRPIYGFACGTKLSDADVSLLQSQHTTLCDGRKDWGQRPVNVRLTEFAGIDRRLMPFYSPEWLWTDEQTGEVIRSDWEHPTTGQGYGRRTGWTFGCLLGDWEATEVTSYRLSGIVFRPLVNLNGSVIPPELVFATEDLLRVERLPPIGELWNKVHCDRTHPAASDANEGDDPDFPVQTVRAALDRVGPHTILRLPPGDHFLGGGSGWSNDQIDFRDVTPGTLRGPLLITGSDPAHPTQFGSLRIRAGTRGVTIAHLEGHNQGAPAVSHGTQHAGGTTSYGLALINLRGISDGDNYCTLWGASGANPAIVCGAVEGLYVETPEGSDQYGVFSEKAFWDTAFLLYQPNVRHASSGTHVFRLQGADHFEFAYVMPHIDGPDREDKSFRNLNIRGIIHCANIHDWDAHPRGFSTNAWAALDAPDVHLTVERVSGHPIEPSPAAGVSVRHCYATGWVQIQSLNSSGGAEHLEAILHTQFLGVRKSGSGAWLNRVNVAPTTGPFRNVLKGDDYGPDESPACHVEAVPGGLAVLALGYPQGGTDQFLKLSWQVKAAGSPDESATRVFGFGADRGRIPLVPGTYQVRTMSGDGLAFGPWSEPIEVG